MEKRAQALRRNEAQPARTGQPADIPAPPPLPYEALTRITPSLGNIGFQIGKGLQSDSFVGKVLCISAILALVNQASAAPLFSNSEPEEWMPPEYPTVDDATLFKEHVFSGIAAHLYKLKKQSEYKSELRDALKPTVFQGTRFPPALEQDIKPPIIEDGALSNVAGMRFRDLLKSDYIRSETRGMDFSRSEVEALLREVLQSNKISTAFTFGSEENAIASVVLGRTGKAYGEKDLQKIQKEFKQLVLDWRSGANTGGDPCRDAAKNIAIAKGLGPDATGFINDMATLLRAKYLGSPGPGESRIVLPDEPETTRSTASQEAIDALEREVVDRELEPAEARTLDEIIDKLSRSLELDPLAQVLKDVEGLTFKDVADSHAIRARYPGLNKATLRSRLKLWADEKGIDTSFPMGSAVHAMATVVKRITGEEFRFEQSNDVIKAFHKLGKQVPLEEATLCAAHILELEKGWPEIAPDHPTAVKKDRIQALMDQLHLEAGSHPAPFNETEVALSALEESTGLTREELTRKGYDVGIAAQTKLEYPHQGFRLALKYVEKSILDHFLDASKDGSDDTYARRSHHLYSKPYAFPKRRPPENERAYTSKVLTVEGKDGKPVELKPFEFMDKAKRQYGEKAESDPWVDALARAMVRERVRPEGMLPDQDEIANEKDQILKSLRPLYATEEDNETMRSRLVSLGPVGEIINLVYLTGDAIKGDWESFTYNAPIVGNLRTYYDAGTHLKEGHYLDALDAALSATPVISAPYQTGKHLKDGKPVDAGFSLAGILMSGTGGRGKAAAKASGGQGLNVKPFAQKIRHPSVDVRNLAKSVDLGPGPGVSPQNSDNSSGAEAVSALAQAMFPKAE